MLVTGEEDIKRKAPHPHLSFEMREGQENESIEHDSESGAKRSIRFTQNSISGSIH
jgi:hypothetical protein